MEQSSNKEKESETKKLILGIKGMPDVLPNETPAWDFFENHWRQLMKLYGYEEIRLPILESTRLFKRSIGEVTDIVEKEMFTFNDRDHQSLSMRPEGTAGCVRACLEHGLLHNQEQRLWYMGPMFRYEKPQMGRFRQFNQVGVEAFGFVGPDIEIEHILMMARFWRMLGIEEHIELQLNTLGSKLTRERYRQRLVDYFTQHIDVLDDDNKRRLKSNPLRILDSKNPEIQNLIHHAPTVFEDLEPEDSEHFEALKARLTTLQIPYRVNARLVRGLDYYNRTVYEWTTTSLGAQGTVCAGGRYDGLVEVLGGKPTFGVGFALGIERVLMLHSKVKMSLPQKCDVYILCVGQGTEIVAMKNAEILRDYFPTVKFLLHCGGGSFKNQFKRADKSGATFAFIFGENELAEGKVGVKFLRKEEEQQMISQEALLDFIENHFTIQRKNQGEF